MSNTIITQGYVEPPAPGPPGTIAEGATNVPARLLADVRLAVDPTLTPDDLPDTVLLSSGYLQAARDWVTARVPTAAVIAQAGGAPSRALYRAVVYWAASLILPVFPQLILERTGQDYQYQRQPVDPLALARRMRARASAEINLAQSASGAAADVASVPFAFGVARVTATASAAAVTPDSDMQFAGASDIYWSEWLR